MKIATTARALPRAVRRAQCLPLPVGGGDCLGGVYPDCLSCQHQLQLE